MASGNKIVGANTGTTAVQVRGVSLGWSCATWEPSAFWNAATVNAMVDDWQAEVIRVPVGSLAGCGSAEDTTGNIARAKTVINAAIAKGVYVIIDWHTHTGESELAEAQKFFTEMAKTYGSSDNVIFEVYNEPVDATWSQIRSYATSVLSTIRAYSDNLVLVGTPHWSQDVDAAANSPVSDPNIAYVVHFYAYSHALSGYTYGGISFQSAINKVLNAGLPVFVSDYGTTHADGGNPNSDDGNHYNTHSASAANTWHSFLDSKKISSCAWNINDKYEGSAFFGTSSTGHFDHSSWTNTSAMTASGAYIYNKLKSYASSAPWRSGSVGAASSSSGSSGSGLPEGMHYFCDFGPITSYGGGCYIVDDDPLKCDTEWGDLIYATDCPHEVIPE
jgi:aryl-phospho-beta-D-glucosidase BglC (GH1 family)